MKSLILVSCYFSSISALTFNCVYVYNANMYTCFPQISGISDSRSLINVTGLHVGGKNNTDVDAVYIDDYSDLDFVPQGMTNFFPNLVAITITSSGVKTLNGDELHEYRHLREFALAHGPLESVPSNFFETTPDIRQISFLNNSIRYVGENSLNSKQNLHWINFELNICIGRASHRPFDQLIDDLRLNCIDDTEPIEPTCAEGNTNDRICMLEEENERLWQENVQIKRRLDEIEEILRQIRPSSYGSKKDGLSRRSLTFN